MAESGIYEIVNLVNGKRYVGSAVSFKKRWTYHRRDLRGGRHHSRHLQHSWRKYGEQSFEFRIIETVDDPRQLIEREQHYINALAPEYNQSPTAGSCLGHRQSAETKARQSARNKRLWADPDFAARMIRCLREGRMKPEVRARNAERMRGNNPFRGKRHSSATREKLADQRRQEWADPDFRAENLEKTLSRLHSPEAIAKRTAKMRGRTLPEAVKVKLAVASRRAWADPEKREKHKAALRAAVSTPEHRAKKSEASRRVWQDPVKRENIIAARRGLRNGSADHQVYTLHHTDGRTLVGVQIELRAETGISPAGMSQLVNGKQKQAKGWSLASPFKEE